jgi:hypothetical protein
MNEYAVHVLKNPAWQAAWDALRAELIDVVEMTPPHEAEVLSAVAHRLWALREVRAELERMMAQETEPAAN